LEVAYSDLEPQHRLAINQIFKAHKVTRNNRSSMTLRVLFTPTSTPVPAPVTALPEEPQTGATEFAEFMGLLGKLRFSKTHKQVDWPLDKLLKVVDTFLEDRKTVVSLQKLQGGKSSSISEMLFRHFSDKSRLRSTLEHSTLDFIHAVQQHRVGCMQVDTFARLLAAEFDATDLLFYKYVKSLTKTQRAQMTYASCLSHSRRLFGAEQEQIHKALELTLNSEIEAVGQQVEPEVLIDTQFFIYLAVWVFHHQRKELGLTAPPDNASPDVSPIEDHQGDIDGYISSIRKYREATRALSTEHTPRTPQYSQRQAVSHNDSRLSMPEEQGIEQEIQSILLSACRRFVKDDTHAKLLAREADALLQIVMMGDEEAWSAAVGDSSVHFSKLLRMRDALTQEGLEGAEAKTRITEFCGALAEITVGLISKE